MTEKEETQEFNAATLFLEIQARLEPAQTTAEGQIGSRKYKYAPLPEVKKIAMQALEGTGVTLIETITPIDGSWGSGHLVCAQLIHAETGVLVNSSTIAIPPRDDMQDLGKCITYARRYNIVTATGMVTEDDDDAAGDKGRQDPIAIPKARDDESPTGSKGVSWIGPVTLLGAKHEKDSEPGAKKPWSMWIIDYRTQDGKMPNLPTFEGSVYRDACNVLEAEDPPMVTLKIYTSAQGRQKIDAVQVWRPDGENTDDGAPF